MSQIKTIAMHSGSIEYVTVGEGYPLLALHGTPGGWEQMAAELSFLTEHGFQLIIPDRPGYGGTAIALGKTPPEQAKLFAEMMQQLGHSKYAVAAWSGGGPCALHLAALCSAHISVLYLEACITIASAYTDDMKKQTEPFFNPKIVKIIKFTTDWFPGLVLKEMLKSEYSCTKAEAKVMAKTLRRQDKGILAYVKQLSYSMIPPEKREPGFRNDVVEFAKLEALPFAKITAPTLILHGKLDCSGVSIEHATTAEQAIANTKLLLLDGVTHVPRLTVDQYPKIKQQVTEFLCANIK